MGQRSQLKQYILPHLEAKSQAEKMGESSILAGGWTAFRSYEIMTRTKTKPPHSTNPLIAPSHSQTSQPHHLALKSLVRGRGKFAGLDMSRPHIMGILNVTPDSFSDGGNHFVSGKFDAGRAIDDAMRMVEEGASIIDVGGESTRPGARPVEVAEEVRRVSPVIRALSDRGVCVSLDTRRAAVMQKGLEYGVRIINDVSALTFDKESLKLLAQSDANVVLMHMQGDPETMQQNPDYSNVILDIYDYLEERLEACERAGVHLSRICLDPGIGFGKALSHNLDILQNMALLHSLGCPLLLGASRKSFIEKLQVTPSTPKDRLGGSLAAVIAALSAGVQIFRVHDVAQTRQAIDTWLAIQGTLQKTLSPVSQ